jgi:hypothetical protein
MMSWVKLKPPVVALLVIGLASFVVFLEVEASDESDEQTGPSAVWQPARSDLARIQQICGLQSGNYNRCFIEQMANFGAPTDAITFTRSYAEQNHGAIAFLQGFRPVDSVDLGYAFFPAGDGFNQRWLLLNGSPAFINVDDLSILPKADMLHDPAYAALRSRFPQIALFDGERGLEVMPATESLPDGGQWFAIDYPLRDQCRACALLGYAIFRFEFDPGGRLLGVKFLKVTPAV